MSEAVQFSKTQVGSADLRKLLVWTVVATQFLVLAMSVLIAARRCVGAVTQPLPSGWLVAIAFSVAGISAASHWCLRRPSLATSVWQGRASWWLPVATMACLGIGLTLPGASTWAIVVFWLVFSVEELLCVWIIGWDKRMTDGGIRRDFFSGGRTSAHCPEDSHVREKADGASHEASGSMEEEFSLDENATQKLIRRETEEGEVIHALLRSSAPVGQQTFWMHLAICPPLRGIPEVDIEQVDGPEANIRVGQAMASGVRLDVRLLETSSQQQRITVELFAHPRTGSRSFSRLED